MRIVDEIPHPQYKITVFNHNNRFTLQIEGDQLTQMYKFRESDQLMTGKEFRALISAPATLEKLVSEFQNMELIRKEMEVKMTNSASEFDFPKIV